MEIRTERLLLREIEEKDWRAFLAYQSDPRYLRHYEFDHRSERDVRALVAMLMAWARERPRTRYQFAIVLDASEQGDDTGAPAGGFAALIGCAGIRQGAPESPDAEFGCELSPDQWGNGYALEAGRALLEFARTELGVQRIVAATVPENRAALALAEKLGMRPVGEGLLAVDLPVRVPPPEV